jgi:hypothetical protein
MVTEVKDFLAHWFEIACMAVVCLWQEVRGEEPDCPKCWKCEFMRIVVLCFGAAVGIKLFTWGLYAIISG